jgi:signal transduction histidine kinase
VLANIDGMNLYLRLRDLHTAPLTRRIILGVDCLSGIVVLLLFAAALLAAHHVDQVSLRKEEKAVEHALEDWVSTVERRQKAFAGWGEAISRVQSNDTAWLADYSGSLSNNGFGFDWSIFLDGKGSVVASYRDGVVVKGASPAVALNMASKFRRNLEKRANLRGGVQIDPPSDIVNMGDVPSIISILPFQTGQDPQLATTTEVLLHVAIEFLDAKSLTAISHHANVYGLKLSRDRPTAARVPVLDSRGTIVRYLTWQPSSPGMATIWGLAPVGSVAVALAAVLAVAISRWLVDASRSVSKSEHELRQNRDELEKLVQARTAEIETKNAELDRLLQQEREASALQRRFVSMISHEFRTPLAIIDAAAQRLTRSRTATAPDYLLEKSVQIRAAAARMVELMESILAAGRIEKGSISINRMQCSIVALIEECVQRRREIAPGHRIHVRLEALPAFCALDAQSIERAISNLLSNAVKYAPHSPDIFVRGWQNRASISISVADNGIGMDADDLPRLFQPYFRARSASGIAGTGIGLNIVREIVELHGGTITAQSRIGEGTTFTMTLPLVNQEPEERAA